MRSPARVGCCGALLLVCSAPAFAAVARLTGPQRVLVDGLPATPEPPIVFEVIVELSTSPTAVGFQWEVSLAPPPTLSGLSFDPAASKAATRILAGDTLRDPLYMLVDDSDGFEASAGPAGLRGGDFSASLSPLPATGRSLGQIHIRIDDETAAIGPHLLEGLDSFLVLDRFGGQEPLEILAGPFEIDVPEPATLAILAAASLPLIARRRP